MGGTPLPVCIQHKGGPGGWAGRSWGGPGGCEVPHPTPQVLLATSHHAMALCSPSPCLARGCDLPCLSLTCALHVLVTVALTQPGHFPCVPLMETSAAVTRAVRAPSPWQALFGEVVSAWLSFSHRCETANFTSVSLHCAVWCYFFGKSKCWAQDGCIKPISWSGEWTALTEGPRLGEMHPIVCSRGFTLVLLGCQKSSLATWPLSSPCPLQLWRPAQEALHGWERWVWGGGYGCHLYAGDRSIKVRGGRALSFFGHTQQVKDVFILVQKQLLMQKVLLWFCAHTMNSLLEHHSWYLGTWYGRFEGWGPFARASGQHGNLTAGILLPMAGRYCFEAALQAAAKRLFSKFGAILHPWEMRCWYPERDNPGKAQRNTILLRSLCKPWVSLCCNLCP